MLGARAASEPTGSTLGTGCEAAGSTGRASIENWFAALQSRALRGCRSRRCRGRGRRLVHGARPSLRHHHTPHGRCGRRRNGRRSRNRFYRRSFCWRSGGRCNCRWSFCGLVDGGRRCCYWSCGRFHGRRHDGRGRCFHGHGRSGSGRLDSLWLWRRAVCRWSDWRLDDDGDGRGHHSDGWADCRDRRLGDDGTGRRFAGHSAVRGDRDNRRCGARSLRNNFPGLWLGRSDGSRRGCDRRHRRRSCLRCRRWCDRLCGHPASFRFGFLLTGQNGLHHVAGLGDVGEINLRSDCLCAARCTCAMASRTGSMIEVRTHLVRLVIFNRTGVRLAGAEAQFC